MNWTVFISVIIGTIAGRFIYDLIFPDKGKGKENDKGKKH